MAGGVRVAHINRRSNDLHQVFQRFAHRVGGHQILQGFVDLLDTLPAIDDFAQREADDASRQEERDQADALIHPDGLEGIKWRQQKEIRHEAGDQH